MTPRDDRKRAGARPGFPGGLFRLLCVALACAASGCGPSDPLEGKVDASNELSYSMWRSRVERDLTPQQVIDLDRSVQEIKFHIMAGGTASGSEAVEDAARQMMDGQTVRHVLQQGLGWELDRAEAERSTLETGMKQNALMTTRPGDVDSADYLVALKERQTVRLKAATDEVNHARERLAAAGGAAGGSPSPAPSP
jgi:hypothetical protein